MSTLHALLNEYGESHQNMTNKRIHFVCVPLIFFSIFTLVRTIPFVVDWGVYVNWANLILGLVLLYYLRLSFKLFIGFVIFGGLVSVGNEYIFALFEYDWLTMFYLGLAIFGVSWIFQFIGHHIEGKKPSFLKDLQFLLVGPAWIMQFIYRHLGIKL